jgi:hypothetical protein
VQPRTTRCADVLRTTHISILTGISLLPQSATGRERCGERRDLTAAA